MTDLTIYLSLTSSPSAPRAPLTIDPNGTTGAELRRKASEVTTVPLPKLKLIFRGRVISDKEEGDVVKEYRLEEGCVVHVMGKPVAAAGGVDAGVAAGGATVASTVPATAGASVTLPAVNNMSVSGGAASASPLAAALTKLRSSNDGTTYNTALVTADKLLGNIVLHPMEEKYRTIKTANPAFARRLGALPGGRELILASGFTIQTREEVEYYVLTPSADAWPELVGAQKEVQRVLRENNASRSVNVGGFGAAANAGNTANNNNNAAANLFPGGIPSGAMGGGGSGAPDMAMMQSMMNDPNMMQNVMGMMNNPMVQNMMRNDPRMANNPMMQQSLNALQSNPEMMNQMSQMMSDPAARAQMMNMMQQQGGQAGGGGGAAGADPFASGPQAMQSQMEQFAQMSRQFGGSSGGFNTGGGGTGTGANTSGTGQSGGAANNNNASGGNNSTGANDGAQTEEEMIAEAIARSLQEQ